MTNNISERTLRRQALGRKNWLFVATDEGGKVNATLVTLLASCEMHGLEPYAYLRDLLCLMPSWPINKVLELAPANWKATVERPEVPAAARGQRLPPGHPRKAGSLRHEVGAGVAASTTPLNLPRRPSCGRRRSAVACYHARASSGRRSSSNGYNDALATAGRLTPPLLNGPKGTPPVLVSRVPASLRPRSPRDGSVTCSVL